MNIIIEHKMGVRVRMNGVESEKVKSNMLLGVIGSLIGALLGGAMWVGIYQLGVIAGFAGIAIIYLSCKGNALLSKSATRKGVIVSCVISVLVLFIAEYLCWGVGIHIALSAEYDITVMESFMAVPAVAFSETNIMELIKEVLIGLILIGGGTVTFIRRLGHRGTAEAVQ